MNLVEPLYVVCIWPYTEIHVLLRVKLRIDSREVSVSVRLTEDG